MNQLGSKIDPKIVLVVSLIVGLLAGYLLDNTIVSQPRIQSLTETVTEQDFARYLRRTGKPAFIKFSRRGINPQLYTFRIC